MGVLAASLLTAAAAQPAAAVTWQTAEVVVDPSAFAEPGALVSIGSDTTIIGYTEFDEEERLRANLLRTVGGVSETTPLFGNSGAHTYGVALASHSSDVDVVWIREGQQGQTLRYRTSDNRGATWSPVLELTGDHASITRAQVARDGTGRVAVVWGDPVREELRARISRDGGQTFGPLRVVASNFVGAPDVAVGGGAVIVAYVKATDADARGDALVRRSTTNGRSWSRPVVLARNPRSDVQVDVDGSTAFAVFERRSAGLSWMSVHRSLNGGASWTGKRITAQTSRSFGQGVLSFRDGVWRVAFVGCQQADCSTRRIWYSRTVSNGASWSDYRDNVITTGPAMIPVGVDATDDGPLVVWSEDTVAGPQVALRTGTQ